MYWLGKLPLDESPVSLLTLINLSVHVGGCFPPDTAACMRPWPPQRGSCRAPAPLAAITSTSSAVGEARQQTPRRHGLQSDWRVLSFGQWATRARAGGRFIPPIPSLASVVCSSLNPVNQLTQPNWWSDQTGAHWSPLEPTGAHWSLGPAHMPQSNRPISRLSSAARRVCHL
jgi:hypothetical protein